MRDLNYECFIFYYYFFFSNATDTNYFTTFLQITDVTYFPNSYCK